MLTFLHGFLGSPEDWQPLARISHKHSCRAGQSVLPDVKDHLEGKVKLTFPRDGLQADGETDAQLCRMVCEKCGLNLPGLFLTLPGHQGRPLDLSLLEKEIPEKTTLIGYSLGGRLAMHFAYRFPKRIERLIILSANPGLEKGKEERMAWDEKWAQLLETEGINLFLEKWYAQSLLSTLDPTQLKGRDAHDPKMLAKILRELSPAKFPSMWDKLQEFSFPILFLFGGNDIKYQPIAERLGKNFSVGFIPDCGHAIHIENPVLCNEKIQEFLEKTL